ncbi:hypothetical protein ACRXCV_00020 (plasmid) [Halobacteriovorax sp. GFR7]|uniref:hypothetical protein n=1 Tax=unclassified Halobacteriovorax TaxID=2639665 RepID=UPI003D99E027
MPVKINLGAKDAQKQAVETTQAQNNKKQTLEDQLVALIGSANLDEAATLFTQMEELKAKVKALESDYNPIKDAIQTVLKDADLPPTKKLILTSDTGTTLEVGALRKSTSIKDKEALYHALEESQEGLFFELSSVGVTDAKNYVPVKGNVGTIYSEGYGNTRGLKFKM